MNLILGLGLEGRAAAAGRISSWTFFPDFDFDPNPVVAHRRYVDLDFSDNAGGRWKSALPHMARSDQPLRDTTTAHAGWDDSDKAILRQERYVLLPAKSKY